MKCAKCGRDIKPWDKMHVGPHKALKCAACGQWTQNEMEQILRRFGATPDAFGCGCAARRT